MTIKWCSMSGLTLELKLELEKEGEVEEERIRVGAIVQTASDAPRIRMIDVIH